MRLQPLPSLWNLYNLTASPYFQDTLEAKEKSTRSLTLFVGRDEEIRLLTQTVFGAAHGSRQAIAGSPGFGKTTLVQQLKSKLHAQDYLTADGLVPIVPDDTTAALFGRVLGMLYDTILANRPHTSEHPAMQDAQILVRATRFTTGGGFGGTALGFGANATRSSTVITPKDLLIDGPRIMRDLMRLVQESDARGVVIHVNNLEALGESDAARAADLFRGLRDPMLIHDGLHFIVVGTTDAVNTVVNTHAQVRSIFSTLALQPFDLADVNQMLSRRYRHLRLNKKQDPIAPADHQAVAALYALYRGDLRGLLKALEDGITPLLGIAGLDLATGAARPITLAEMRTTLQKRYADQLSSLTESKRVDQLSAWGTTAPDATHTQKSLEHLWDLSQGAVSNAIRYLVQQGYVIALPRTGSDPIQYVLSGTSRLIFG